MKVSICAVGKLRKGPELDLITDYLDRFGKAGRSFGLGPATILEVEDKRNLGMEAEAALLERAIPAGSVLVTLDERGDLVSSPDFATRLGGWRSAARGSPRAPRPRVGGPRRRARGRRPSRCPP